MPPLNQPKSLYYICCSEFSRFAAISIRNRVNNSDLKWLGDMFRYLPTSILESLYYWVIQASLMLIKVETDTDDEVIFKDYCSFIKQTLKLILQENIRFLNQDFSIDLRKFANFSINEAKEEEQETEIGSNQINHLKIDEPLLNTHTQVADISEEIAQFLKRSKNLLTFSPGLFVIDRTASHQHKLSLVYSSPMVLINLVSSSKSLTRLNLLGYEDLSDIVLEFISGQHEDSGGGLPLLTQIILPDRSYLTEHGVCSLLQRLKYLQYLIFPGNLAKVFSLDWEPVFGKELLLREFSQMMSMTSGGVEEGAEDDDGLGEVKCWTPSAKEIGRINDLCPNLSSLRVLCDDRDFQYFQPLHLTQLEAHITWSGVTAGFQIFLETSGGNLTSVDLTLLDNYSWAFIVAIGRHCPLIRKLHLTLWREDMADLHSMQGMLIDSVHEDMPEFQPGLVYLEDLSIKCELYVEFLPETVFHYFLNQCQKLKILQYTAPLDWLVPSVVVEQLRNGGLPDLEMLIISNTSSEPMELGIETIESLIEHCQNLAVLGNLRTWANVDYFKLDSENYMSKESAFYKLKESARSQNWDLDLEAENLDTLYNRDKFVELE